MRLAHVRLYVAAAAFAAWVGWLGWQALTRGRFPVVSHSQLLVSALDVIAEVRTGADGRPDPQVTVAEVHWPTDQDRLAGQTITVTDLPAATGYAGPGLYILPLAPGQGGAYGVAGLPPSPGFDGLGRPPHFIYPLTPITRRQLDDFPKPVNA